MLALPLTPSGRPQPALQQRAAAIDGLATPLQKVASASDRLHKLHQSDALRKSA
jgi:hypothetical protein